MKRHGNPEPRFGREIKQNGVTLIEVLITMVVIALGLLGHAKLITSTLSHNNSAYMRSLATLLTYDVVECMLGNRAVAINGGYNIAFGGNPTGGSVAGDDLVYWKTQLAGSLPAGDGSVTVDAQGNATIVVRWDDNRDGNLVSLTTQTRI